MNIKQQLEKAKASKLIKGQSINHKKRYAAETRHMVIFDITIPDASTGDVGDRIRVFLSEERYAELKILERQGKITIVHRYHVKKGTLTYTPHRQKNQTQQQEI